MPEHHTLGDWDSHLLEVAVGFKRAASREGCLDDLAHLLPEGPRELNEFVQIARIEDPVVEGLDRFSSLQVA